MPGCPDTDVNPKLFQSVVNDPSNKLHVFVPTHCNVGYNLRRERRFYRTIISNIEIGRLLSVCKQVCLRDNA